ncbi:nucleotidyltransferase [Bacillus sp. FJAT-42315]|uniref:nucleotidyltransferase n=1 Tax=Bacillus sp. FJAT-42315 TaxID=2014077 RepID=UPI000C245772|nr:nucleotidyltransferase [Bacillus sp. FJAT-42315]
MKTVGIVVEYNPFHNGHLYHAQKARETANADVVIAVMSGHFLQRGEPALIHKWARTRMALQNGVDLVVELPYAFSTQKAEIFSFGAISILKELACDSFCFGSENGQVEPFLDTLEMINSAAPTLNPLIHSYMKEGYSFPKAQTLAREQLFQDSLSLDLSMPNNILGYHYVQANDRLTEPMQPLTIKRQQAGYHDESLAFDSIASATGIRKEIADSKHVSSIKRFVPESTLTELTQYHNEHHIFHSWSMYWPLLKYRLLSASIEELQSIYEITEGIEFRLKETARHAPSFIDFMEQVKTKRYTWTRIQRMLVHILTNTTKEEMKAAMASIRYIRLLGMNGHGRAYMKTIKKELSLPLIARAAAHKELLALDMKASDVYMQGVQTPQLLNSEFTQPPILLP